MLMGDESWLYRFTETEMYDIFCSRSTRSGSSRRGRSNRGTTDSLSSPGH